MITSDLSILVVGAGAVGGITAALLRKHGVDVEIVCKYDDYAGLISERGIEVKGACGDFTVKMPAYPSAAGVYGEKDIILLATKATDMQEALKGALPVLKEDGYLISMQNGICVEILASMTDTDHLISCITGWGATMEAPGKLTMTSKGDFILGYPYKKTDDFLLDISSVLASVVPVKTTDNIMGHLYSKLIINSCITSLGAICGLFLGKMLFIRKIRRIFIEIVKEALDVADMMNIKVEIFGGKLDFRIFQEANGFLAFLRCHLLLIIIGYKYRKLKSSSLQSLQRGKPSEVDYLNGYIVRNGKKYGLTVPVNEHIVNIIHDIEQKKRAIGQDNFNDPFFNRFG